MTCGRDSIIERFTVHMHIMNASRAVAQPYPDTVHCAVCTLLVAAYAATSCCGDQEEGVVARPTISFPFREASSYLLLQLSGQTGGLAKSVAVDV